MKITTATGKTFNVAWAGVATIDGALRFELIGVSLRDAFDVFSNDTETKILIYDWDGQVEEFYGYVLVKTVDVQPSGNIIVALSKR